MLLFVGGLAIGGFVGYLIWEYLNPPSGNFSLNLKIIAEILGLVLGGVAAIAFPAASSGFVGWTVGILAGFAFIPGKNAYHRWEARREEALQEEIHRANMDWSYIDHFIKKSMQDKMQQDKHSTFEGTITLNLEELEALNYREEVLIQIMRHYAYTHVDEGVKYKKLISKNEEGYEEEIHRIYQPIRQSLTAAPQTTARGQFEPDDKVSLSFQTTYRFGNDGYDDSFSIDSPSGEFLGECGAGISAAIGDGVPKKVTAFEIWLFDKQDVQTPTKVLTSPNAYADPDIRKDLAKKGELVLAKPGRPIILETKKIQVVARVVECSFAAGDSPRDNYFESLSMEFQVRLK